ncbi:hypothetical protein OOK53_36510 [Streptomyces anulatus]|nr:hypothetical protein [Streptomyces anulatus]
MAAADHSPDIQLSQTRHRATLVESWHIEPGSSVLELGCGQGDMTAVLAEAVGPKRRGGRRRGRALPRDAGDARRIGSPAHGGPSRAAHQLPLRHRRPRPISRLP